MSRFRICGVAFIVLALAACQKSATEARNDAVEAQQQATETAQRAAGDRQRAAALCGAGSIGDARRGVGAGQEVGDAGKLAPVNVQAPIGARLQSLERGAGRLGAR